MLFLWIFGDNVEDRFGHVGYAVFYLAGGIVAAGAHVLATPGSTVFTVGASGAIAAVMGAYLLLYPGARIESLVIVFVFVRVISVPAFVWLGLWFVFQVVSGSADSRDSGEGGVAWFAHIGGFAFGAAVVLLLGMRGERPLRAV
jgi:membrane associated rhomboid family serine protease